MQIGIDTLGLTVMSIKFKATIQDEEAADAQKDHFWWLDIQIIEMIPHYILWHNKSKSENSLYILLKIIDGAIKYKISLGFLDSMKNFCRFISNSKNLY